MFRFTIRDVLWLTVVVALAVGWGTQVRRYNRLHDAVKTSTPRTVFLFDSSGEFLGSAESKTDTL